MRIPTYRGTERVSINMTPMIDVTFLLIIFFLVSSHLAKQENFIPLDLPTTTVPLSDLVERETLTVQVLPEGEFRIGSQSSALEDIRRALQEKNALSGAPVRVRIRTDRRVPYEYIAGLLKTCAMNGNNDIVFAVYDAEGQK